ncbi:hypothetical protein VA596_43450 [Amycolatopsis sp., V23-08]|uniref:Uncharacterized protein n=1 Tax=Amycolatopsis heterodermiae TaxID=3110235 RepID=A0ABU5RJJ2_9PSEU|nr:hypothetical protein [Amycolatopsis sp., V23-08]MEA5366450.1 hypothetical protein [Amycolatopsis sp., V23-08]
MPDNFVTLIESLRAVSRHAEPTANALMVRQMTPEKQREYATLLRQLADLLDEHADNQETASTKPEPPTPAGGRHALRDPSPD